MVMQMEARGQEAREGAEERRTAAEYLAGADSRGSELIDGKLYGMGAPDLMHAQMVLLIGEQLRACVKEDSRRGLVLPVPVGVGFREDAYTLLLPDNSVLVIISEELPPYLLDQKDLDSVIGTINNRAKTVMAER